MKDGFIKVAAATPSVRVADCSYNADNLIETMRQAYAAGAKVLVTPELGITGCTCGDLFGQAILLNGALDALFAITRASAGMEMLTFVGMPMRAYGALYNVAVCISNGHIIGVTPKTHLRNFAADNELRYFTPADDTVREITLGDCVVPFGSKLLYSCENCPDFTVAAEIGSDLWAPCPPSVSHTAAGASIIVNLGADCESVAADTYRRSLITGQSARLHCGYVFANAGYGESTTDLVFAGHDLIAENGALIKESEPFESGLILSEIDVSMLMSERIRSNLYPSTNCCGYHTIEFSMQIVDTVLTRPIEKMSFVPSDAAERDRRAKQILSIQAHGLKRRIEHAWCKTAVIGISGGLDSCLALLAAVRAMDLMQRPRTDIIAVTMPCFGTTKRTRGNAEKLCELLGVTLRTIDIKASVDLHFADIGHDKNEQNVVFENAQARERTQILMDIANQTGGLVVGTGDLSELALGWATYNGDQMSMYGVNASLSKTLVRDVVRYCASAGEDKVLAEVLLDILATPVSPELLPADEDTITQQTESIVGPYELHDFYLYYLLRFGFAPHKILRLAEYAFEGEYDRKTILYWLRTFVRRFFIQQFKRSCLPDGPKVGSVSLSPRGDWRMPSDAVSKLWLDDIDAIK